MKYAAYSEYKTSGSNWLDAVPSHWNVKPLKLIVKMPITDGPHETPEFTPDGVPFASVEAVWDGKVHLSSVRGYISEEDHRRYGKKYHPKRGDIFIVKSGSTTGKIAIVDFDDDFNVWSPLAAVRCDGSQAHPEFVFYTLSSSYFQRLVQVSWSFGTQPNIGMGVLGNLPAVLPPVAEQQAIARFLDAKTAQIDALVAQKRQLIDKLREKRQALIARTVTRGLPPEAAKAAGLESNPEIKDSGVDWLPVIPAHWRLSPLKRIVCTPITDGPHETPEFPLEGVPFVSAEAVQDGRVHLSSMRGYISQEDHERYSKKYCPKKNDIFIVKSGSTTGKVAIVDFDDEFNVWSPLAAVRCDLQKALPNFVFFALSSEYFQGLVQVSWSFGTQPNIGMGVIGSLAVVLPPVSEQRLIADFLKIETDRINDLIERAQAAIVRLTEYRQALITSAVTGKIDVRELA